jgi:hypothetical protein
MYDVNDDMEDLFRRAAESYPLKTDSLDWEKVEKGLSTEEESVPANEAALNKTNRSWLLLVLLIPVMWICNNYTHRSTDSIVKNAPAHNHNSVSTKNSSPTIKSPVTNEVQANKPSLVKNYSSGKENKLGQEKHNSRPIVTPNSINVTNVKSNTTTASTPTPTAAKKNVSENSFSQSLSNAGDVTSAQPFNSNLPETKDKAGAKNSVNTPATTDNSKSNESITEIGKTKNVVTTSAELNKAKEKVIAKRLRKVYVGIIGTLDVSTVKFQSTKTPGKGLGLLAGFQITPRLSVESGASLQKKFYFSDAKYFNPKTSYTSSTYKLISVDGNCDMWEVPINLRYTFKTTAKNSWFALAGASTYIMKSENYGYTYESYGSISERYVKYTNSSTNWFSAMNVAVGYERRIGAAGSLRVEPYLKVPLKGVGWGRLPITSTGLNIGFTRRLF